VHVRAHRGLGEGGRRGTRGLGGGGVGGGAVVVVRVFGGIGGVVRLFFDGVSDGGDVCHRARFVVEILRSDTIRDSKPRKRTSFIRMSVMGTVIFQINAS
jgi:hypothetical protein